MSGLEFLAPTSVGEAVAALAGAKGAGKLLAGGTDLLVQTHTGRLRPQFIVDLKRIPSPIGISAGAGGFLIGAATPAAQVCEHRGLAKAWPGLVEAAGLIGSTQIQGRASLGGNLCNGSPAADSVPALIAASAVCVIEGPGGRREAPVESVQTGPGKTSLAADEILVGFRLPARPARSADAYQRLIPRTEMDIAVVGVGVNLTLDAKGAVAKAHVAVGAVAPTTLLVEAAADALIGSKLETKALDAAVEAVRAHCKPISDKRGSAAYRIKIAGVLTRRVAQIAYERAMA